MRVRLQREPPGHEQLLEHLLVRAGVARDECVHGTGQRGEPGDVRALDLRAKGVQLCREDAGGEDIRRNDASRDDTYKIDICQLY